MTGTALRLAAFGVALAATFGVAYAVGDAVDPIRPADAAPHGREHR